MDNLTTERLLIRPFQPDDLAAIHRILRETFTIDEDSPGMTFAERTSWLEWNRLNAEWFQAMNQPPYGDRAVVLRNSNEVIGTAGYVPLLMPFDQIPELARTPGPLEHLSASTEVGLFWAIDRAHQRQGYATEAANALIDYAFAHLRLWRILATTQYDNYASQGVMRKAGMTLTRNPSLEPSWMQVIGVCYASETRQQGESRA